MTIDNTQIMAQRAKDFEQYKSYVESLDSLLNNFQICLFGAKL